MPGMTLAEASAHITSTNEAFAVTETEIRGTTYRTFKNAPANLREMLKSSAEAHGDGADDYLIYNDERWTYAEFCAESNRMAHAMTTQLGVKPGDKVAIAMRNYPELLLLFMAITSLGGVVVFLNAWWTSTELDYALGDSGAQFVFADGPRAQRLQPIAGDIPIIGVRDGEALTDTTYSGLRAAEQNTDWPTVTIDPDADFAVMYSSGTTGHPKGVVQTHRGAISAVYTWVMSFGLPELLAPADAPPAPAPAERQITLIVTPLFHVTATHPMFLLSIPGGSGIALIDKWDADAAIEIIEREQITRFLGVPTQSADLNAAVKKRGITLDSLEYLGAGGAKRPAAQVDELAQTFPKAAVASGWGMTETNAVGLSIGGPDYVARPGVAGRLLPPLQDLRILDDDGQELPTGEIGEITVKSPANMRCYLNKPEATAEVFQDGWLRTGDLGMVDADGYVTILDRKKNIIIRGGENIACLDVEGAIHRHPAVAEACAFSIPDERLGEVVGAGVQLKAGASVTAEDLTTFLSDHIAKFKIPVQFWFRDTPLPRGATDKLDRRVLQAECLKKENT